MFKYQWCMVQTWRLLTVLSQTEAKVSLYNLIVSTHYILCISWIIKCLIIFIFIQFGARAPTAPPPLQWTRASSFMRFLYHTHDAPHSVGLLWTSYPPMAEMNTWKHPTLTTNKYPYPRWDSNPQSQHAAAADPYLRPRGHWDRHDQNVRKRKLQEYC